MAESDLKKPDTNPVEPRWQSCLVAAPGPSLTRVESSRVIAVQDAWHMYPDADVLYGCDSKWWNYYKGTEFKGEKWSSHHPLPTDNPDFKLREAELYGLNLVEGNEGNAKGFSFDPQFIHYGDNSGFQAINLAILFGCTFIVLMGFDMQHTNGRQHVGPDHPREIGGNRSPYHSFIRHFDVAAENLPDHIRIVNTTPGSALQCFPYMELCEALSIHEHHDSVHRHRTIAHT